MWTLLPITAVLLAAACARMAVTTQPSPETAATPVAVSTATSPVITTYPATMRGLVLDGATGQPLEGASVGLMPADTVTSAGQGFQLRTSRDGAFELRNIAPGRYALDVSARGFNAKRAAIYFAPSQVRTGYRYTLTPAATCSKLAGGKKNPACP